MNRGDLIKLVAQQLVAEAEAEKVDSVQAESDARRAFFDAVINRVRTEEQLLINTLLRRTSGNESRLVVDVKYTDGNQCIAVVRDGEEYDCSFRVRLPVPITDSLLDKRNAWYAASVRVIDAEELGTTLGSVQKEAWTRVVGAVLDNTDAGNALLCAAASVRAELKRDGWEGITRALSPTCDNTKTESSISNESGAPTT